MDKLKQLYAKLQCLRRSKGGKFHKLEIPWNPNDNTKQIKGDLEKWEVLEDNEEVYIGLKERNPLHFGQAETETTPFFSEPLKSEINYTATSASADYIIDGVYDMSSLDAVTEEFIKRQKKDHKVTVTEQLTPGKVLDRFKIWRE